MWSARSILPPPSMHEAITSGGIWILYVSTKMAIRLLF